MYVVFFAMVGFNTLKVDLDLDNNVTLTWRVTELLHVWTCTKQHNYDALSEEASIHAAAALCTNCHHTILTIFCRKMTQIFKLLHTWEVGQWKEEHVQET